MVDSQGPARVRPEGVGVRRAARDVRDDKGWFPEPPQAVDESLVRARARIEIIGGIGIVIAGASTCRATACCSWAGAIAIAGIFTLLLARAMPARTLPGATIRAMLAAYRRTLQKTLEMSRSMDQVVASKALPWLETPDQAVVWGVALGLRERRRGRPATGPPTDLRHGRAEPSVAYLPHWYGSARLELRRCRRRRRHGARPVLGFGDPEFRQHDGGDRDDREQRLVVRRRVRRRGVGRRRRRSRRRLLAAAADPAACRVGGSGPCSRTSKCARCGSSPPPCDAADLSHRGGASGQSAPRTGRCPVVGSPACLRTPKCARCAGSPPPCQTPPEPPCRVIAAPSRLRLEPADRPLRCRRRRILGGLRPSRLAGPLRLSSAAHLGQFSPRAG